MTLAFSCPSQTGSLSLNVKQLLRSTAAAAVGTKTSPEYEQNIGDNMEQGHFTLEDEMVNDPIAKATEISMDCKHANMRYSLKNADMGHGLTNANWEDVPYRKDAMGNVLTNGNIPNITDAHVQFHSNTVMTPDNIPPPHRSKRPFSKIPRYKIKNLRVNSRRGKSKLSTAGGQSTANPSSIAAERLLTKHYGKSYATYQRTTSSNRSKRLTEETACMTSVHTQVFMHPQPNNFQPMYQTQTLPGESSSCRQAFPNRYNTPANSFEMYNRLLDNFYKFCDVLLTKHGFTNAKTFEERRAEYNEIVIRNATICHNTQQEDPSPAKEFHKRFDECLKEMKNREDNANIPESKKLKRKRHHQSHKKCPELPNEVPSHGRYRNHMNSSIILKVNCQNGVMKLKKLKPSVKKNLQTRFHSVPTQTFHSSLLKRHSRCRPGKRVSFSSVDDREKQFTHLAKTCFSSCRRVDQVAKLNSEDVFKIILPDDYDFDKLKHTMLNRGDPVIGILKTGKKNNCCFKKGGSTYYEIQLKAKGDPVLIGGNTGNANERRKLKKY
ncbi:hypothetical protein WDU94_003364 [Cyamophila willieti]